MAGSVKRTTELLQLWQAGDESARGRLLERCCNRLKCFAHRMLRQRFSHVGRWEETDDVLQRAMLRLYKSLEAVTLESGRHFYNLAATQIRRELIELARHYYGPQGLGTRHETDHPSDGVGGRTIPKHERPDSSAEPSSLAEWTDFHRRIEKLPPEEKEVADLRWYQGLTHEEVAEVLHVDERTVRRRWIAVKTKLRTDFCGEPPAE